MNLKGSCLCGAVQYEITGPLSQAVYCHCHICQKAQGSAFRARASVNAADFRWTAGELYVRYFRSSPSTRRAFCGTCGSPLISKDDRRTESYGIALGSLDDDPGLRPTAHVYVESKAPWHEITDRLAQYEGISARKVHTGARADPERAAVPEGFVLLDLGSPYRDVSGPFYKRVIADQVVLALRIDTKHTNGRGIAHGGLLLTLADMALGYSIHYQAGPNPPTLLTAGISSEFIGSARVGDWVEAHTEVLRIGKRMAFANAYLIAADRRILRASGVFAASPNPGS